MPLTRHCQLMASPYTTVVCWVVLQALMLFYRGRTRFLSRCRLDCVILWETDEFLDASPQLSNALRIDVEHACVFEVLIGLYQSIGCHDSRCGRIDDDLIP